MSLAFIRWICGIRPAVESRQLNSHDYAVSQFVAAHRKVRALPNLDTSEQAAVAALIRTMEDASNVPTRRFLGALADLGLAAAALAVCREEEMYDHC